MKIRNSLASCLTAILFIHVATFSAPGQAKRLIVLDDLAALREVSEPQVSPDGEWVAYTVTTVDAAQDKKVSHIWMTSWDGRHSLQLTLGKESEEHPRWSPDGRWLAFLSSRGDDDEVVQVWLLNRNGGEADRITDFKGNATDFVWSPDSKRLALIVRDEDPDKRKSDKDKTTPKPIVIDRFQFKQDKVGYLRNLRDHLYVFDLATRKAEILTPGDYDEALVSYSLLLP